MSKYRGLFKALFFLSPILITICGQLGISHFVSKYSSPLLLNELKKSCNKNICKKVFTFVPENQNVIIPYPLLRHELRRGNTSIILNPIGKSSRNQEESSWFQIFNYQLKPNVKHVLTITYPKNASRSGFVGLRPRQSNSSEILRTQNLVEKLTSFGMQLSVLYFLTILALFTLKGFVSPMKKRREMTILLVPLILTSFYFFIGNHSFDSVFMLIPSGEKARLLIYRASSLYLAFLPLILYFSGTNLRRNIVCIIPCLIFSYLSILSSGPMMRIYPAMSIIGVITTFFLAAKQRSLFLSLLALAPLYSVLQMAGVIAPDQIIVFYASFYPQIYLAYRLWNDEVKDVFPIFTNAFSRINRDIQIKHFLEKLTSFSSLPNLPFLFDDHVALQNLLAVVSKALDCKRVTLLISHEGFTKTANYDLTRKDRFMIFEDEDIKGAILTRSFLYQESFILERADQAKESGLTLNQKHDLSCHQYFTVIPLIVHGQTIGTLALTKFKDKLIEDNPFFKNEIIQNSQQVKSHLENALASIIKRVETHNIKAQEEYLQLLDKVLNESIDENHFLDSMTQTLSSKYKSSLFIFERHKDEVILNAGDLNSPITPFFQKNNLSLSKNTGNKIGPLVVAFTERAPSVIYGIAKNLKELSASSLEMLERYDFDSILCIPFNIGKRDLAVMILGKASIIEQSPLKSLNLLKAFKKIEKYYLRSLYQGITNALVPSYVIDKLMNGEETFEQDEGLLTMIDLKKSTLLSSLLLPGKWMEIIQGESPIVREIAKKYECSLVEVRWDAFYIIKSNCKSPTSEDEVKILELSIELANHFEQVYQNNFREIMPAEMVPKPKIRSVVVHGNISRDIVTIADSKKWDIIGETMAQVHKLEDSCKGFSEGLVFSTESLFKSMPMNQIQRLDSSVPWGDEKIISLSPNIKYRSLSPQTKKSA